MPINIDANKLNDDQKRRAEHIADRLEKQGVGRDEAKKRALHEVMNEMPGGQGGGSHAGGEAKKDSSHVGDRRLGSDSNES